MALVDLLAFFVALKSFIEWRAGKAEKSPSFGETDSAFLQALEQVATIVGFVATILDFIRDAYSLFTWSPPEGEETPGQAGAGLGMLYMITLGLIVPSLITNGAVREGILG